MDRITFAPLAVVIVLIATFFLFSSISSEPSTGLFTIYLADCGDGDCTGNEDYLDCPSDCCESDCTATDDSVCHIECNSYPLTTPCSFSSGCNDLNLGQTICADSSNYVTCCGGAPTACALGTECTGGSCTACSVECSIDANCNDSNALTTDVCLNPGACNSDCNYTGCTVECNNDAGCDDSNTMTTDVCLNPGVCSADCNYTGCTVECNNDAGCDDSNSSTTDTCLNPGTCSADCNYTGCVVECNSDANCNDSNSLTTDTCTSPGSCSSDCSNTPCSVLCNNNAGCEDSNSMTVDVCMNPGTCSASCSNESCSIPCYSNLDCDDSNSETTDVCANPGTCDANCTYSGCTIACDSSADCYDGNPDTTDTCVLPNTCNAECRNTTCIILCSANGDCFDDDPSTIDKCIDQGTCDSYCSNEPCSIACSTDSDCDDSNPVTLDECIDPRICASACTHTEQQQLTIEFPPNFDVNFSRGEAIDLNVLVRDDQNNPIEDADVSLTDSVGNIIDLNSIGNGYYIAIYNVPIDLPLGDQSLSFSADTGDRIGRQQLQAAVNKGNIKAILIEPKELRAITNQKVELKFRLIYDNNAIVKEPDVNAMLNGVPIPLQLDNNLFVGHYFFSDADIGQASLEIDAKDDLGNSGTTFLTFSVEQPFPWFLLALIIALIVAVLIVLYLLKRMGKLFFLEKKRGKLALSKKKAQLKKAVAKGKDKKHLDKKIADHEKELKKTRKEIKLERKKQVILQKELPTEAKHSLHKTTLSLSLLPGKVKGIFSKPGKIAKNIENERRIKKIDSEVAALRDRIQNVESEFCKQTIKEDYFRQKLFEYREKIHVLELERKKL